MRDWAIAAEKITRRQAKVAVGRNNEREKRENDIRKSPCAGFMSPATVT
jgi:hypothetical protein